MRWEGREPFPSDAITTLGNNNAASLLLLSFVKVSNTEDLLNKLTCQETGNRYPRSCETNGGAPDTAGG